MPVSNQVIKCRMRLAVGMSRESKSVAIHLQSIIVGGVSVPRLFYSLRGLTLLGQLRVGLFLMKLYPRSAKSLAIWPRSTQSPDICARCRRSLPNCVSVSVSELGYCQHL